MWKKWRRKTGKENRCPQSGREMKTRKTKTAMVDCIKSDLYRKRGRRMETIQIDRRNWKLLTESDAKIIITIKCNLTL